MSLNKKRIKCRVSAAPPWFLESFARHCLTAKADFTFFFHLTTPIRTRAHENHSFSSQCQKKKRSSAQGSKCFDVRVCMESCARDAVLKKLSYRLPQMRFGFCFHFIPRFIRRKTKTKRKGEEENSYRSHRDLNSNHWIQNPDC